MDNWWKIKATVLQKCTRNIFKIILLLARRHALHKVRCLNNLPCFSGIWFEITNIPVRGGASDFAWKSPVQNRAPVRNRIVRWNDILQVLYFQVFIFSFSNVSVLFLKNCRDDMELAKMLSSEERRQFEIRDTNLLRRKDSSAAVRYKNLILINWKGREEVVYQARL